MTNRDPTGAIVMAVFMPQSGTKNRVCRLSEGVPFFGTPLSLCQNVAFGVNPDKTCHKNRVSRVLWGVKRGEGRSVAALFTRIRNAKLVGYECKTG